MPRLDCSASSRPSCVTPEIDRLAAALLLQSGGEPVAAERHLRTALVIARDRDALALELRTAADLRSFVFKIVARRRMTVILVTHNLREALEVADRLVLLTARPAGLLASIPLPTPRSMRTTAWVEQGRSDLAARFSSVAD